MADGDGRPSRLRCVYFESGAFWSTVAKSMPVIPDPEQLTTRRAADLLGVSRPHFLKLLDRGDLPYQKAGSHRRVYLKDLLAYQKRRDLERKAALDRITKEAFESGLYDSSGIPEGAVDE